MRFKGHQNTSKNFIRAGFGQKGLVLSGSEVTFFFFFFLEKTKLIFFIDLNYYHKKRMALCIFGIQIKVLLFKNWKVIMELYIMLSGIQINHFLQGIFFYCSYYSFELLKFIFFFFFLSNFNSCSEDRTIRTWWFDETKKKKN